MSDASSVHVFLSQAKEREKVYDWLSAVELYKTALGSVPATDFLKMGQVQERMGYAFYRAAMQVESANEFRERMGEAASCYGRAKEFYSRLSEPEKTPWMLRCDAMITYMGYWLTSQVPEKKKLLSDCWRLAKESLKSFEQAADALEYGKTYNQLATCVVFSFYLEWNFQVREKMMKEALELGEQTVKFLSTLGDPDELAKAHAKTSVFQDAFIQYFIDLDEQERTREKALSHWQKAIEISEEIALLELLSSTAQVDHENIGWDINVDGNLGNFNKALEHANRTKDKFLIGRALDWLAYCATWKLMASESQGSAAELVKTVLQYAEEARRNYSCVSFISARDDVSWIESPHSGLYLALALVESNLKKRRELSEKAFETAPETLKKAEDSGYPEIIRYAHSIFSVTLTKLAALEMNSDEKKRLLEEALGHGNEANRMTEQLEPFDYWDRGVHQGFSMETRSELAELARDYETKRDMLKEATSDGEKSLKLCAKHAAYLARRGAREVYAALGIFQCQLGTTLNRLFELSDDKNDLRRAAEAFAEAAQSFQKLNLTSRMAECYWKSAQICDKLGDHFKASENFEMASTNYKAAAEKIHELEDFYQNHAIYMQAWSEIEKARHHHSRQEYGSAEEHFDKAASLHRSLKQWSYLAPNYSAWTQVEHAEELSRKEQSEEALQTFEQAAKLFTETRKSLERKLGEIENLDEKTMASNLAKASDARREYCLGRMALEEAKILDKKGDHYSSSEKYNSAAETFEKLSQASESEQEQKEFKLIITLSRAWQKMTLAETEASPALYAEASQLFEKAKEFSPNEKTKMLVLGNSRFCRALEAGTRFVDTRNSDGYTDAMKCLETASNYYIKAGFPKVSEYSEATKLLFDAYLHIDGATKENDPEKKAKLYTMVEKILQTSAGSFMRAEHPEKREQVLGLLEKIKKERELAVSLAEVLHTPSIASTTSAFTTPTPTREQAVGSERFEHADVQAHVITRQRELKVGESLGLEIELVNAGKGPALLTKITELIPEGFEVSEKPEVYRVEDSYIDMKGKRLDPLKMVEVKVVLRPRVQGAFPIKPRVLYIDENGKYKSHEPESITITVKELGIKGWIKGER